MVLPPVEPSRRARAPEVLSAQAALLAWFRADGPAYPWRRTEDDPYAVLVSEVMLQQTQAGRVVQAFPTFLERFPDVGALAAASRADVLRAWGGLGYPRRAAALQDAARIIIRDLDGSVPGDVRSLQELPGVGPYTAAAVASIAFGEPIPAIDTNARKVMARLALGLEPHEASSADISGAAARWLSRDAPGDWNQAVMNLGREVCRPTPRCDVCPLADVCRFHASGRATERGSRRSGRSQPAFEGSMRQVRGGVLRELRGRDRAATIGTIAAALSLPVTRVDGAVDALESDGLLERTSSGRIRLPR
ncbi:MAG: A/G-specific adenine glycosylase [Actinomycetota bacterium]